MRLTIFSRLVMSYTVILLLVAGAGIYAIEKLLEHNVTISLIRNDSRIINYREKLTDALLAEMRFEKKYVVMKDYSLFNSSVQERDYFNRYLDELLPLASTPETKEILAKVAASHKRYQTLFDEEVELLRTNRRYPQERYKQEKDRAFDEITAEMDKLKVLTQQSTRDKIEGLGIAGARASKIAVILYGASLIFVVIISIVITRSITRPLSALEAKTKEIARGDFEGGLNISSPPEIRELADSFNLMCDRLKEVDKIKSDFYSLMSHELRTPLTSIKEGTNLLLEGVGGEANEKQKRLLTIIAQESKRLIDLVNSLLDLSKMEAGMTAYNFTQLNLGSLIQRAVVEIEPLCEAKKITIETAMEAGLPLVKIDGERMLQVLRNLIGNAIKFTPNSGHIRITARPVDRGVEVSVADTGAGIPQESLASIFDKFHQARRTRSSSIKGTGLGLAIVKHIINAHGGRVWAESTQGQGSTFFFVLPA